MDRVISYFSGTGNGLRTARTITKEMGGARLISMRNDPAGVPAAAAEMIGFINRKGVCCAAYSQPTGICIHGSCLYCRTGQAL